MAHEINEEWHAAAQDTDEQERTVYVRVVAADLRAEFTNAVLEGFGINQGFGEEIVVVLWFHCWTVVTLQIIGKFTGAKNITWFHHTQCQVVFCLKTTQNLVCPDVFPARLANVLF